MALILQIVEMVDLCWGASIKREDAEGHQLISHVVGKQKKPLG